jgi:hypothetical protein
MNISLKPWVDGKGRVLGGRKDEWLFIYSRPESDGMLRGGGGDEEALMQVNCGGVGGGEGL